MSEETKTPEQIAQEAMNGLVVKEAQKLAQQHINIVQLRVQSMQMAIAYLNEHPEDEGTPFVMAQDILDYLTGAAKTAK
jgi:hypothetical protein